MTTATTAVEPVLEQQAPQNAASTLQIAKQNRLKYGKSGKPIEATAAWHRDMANFPDKAIKAEVWVLENANTGTIVFANTYNGTLGSDWEAGVNTFLVSNLDPRKHRKRMKKMTLVPVEQCPVAIKVESKNETTTANA